MDGLSNHILGETMKKKVCLLTLLMVGILLGGYVGVVNAQDFPVTVVDDAGRTVTIESEPQRIVSLAPSNTEILFALGLGSRVVGVTPWCDYPPEVKDLVEEGNNTVVGVMPTNIELIISLEPDLVLAYTLMDWENLQTLEDMGIPVLVLDPATIDDVYDDILMVGKVTGVYDNAVSLVEQMQTMINNVEKKVENVQEKVKVAHMCWLEPIWVSGSGTFINNVIEKAGGVNVFSDVSGSVMVSPETIIQKNPDIIVYTSVGLQTNPSEVRSQIKEMFPTVNAVKNDKVYLLLDDAANMLERPGPGLADGVETLAKIFYPQLYGGYMPKIITERKVTISYYAIGEGYSEHQLKALTEAKNLLKIEGDVREAYEKLLKTGVISSEIPSIPKDSPTYTMLIQLYGENLERYPTIEGRVQLLYAMGLLKI